MLGSHAPALVCFLAMVIPLSQAQTPDIAQGKYVQTVAELDDPRRYCFDLSGYPTPDFTAPVQAHTCKEGYEHRDQLVDATAAPTSRLHLPGYDRCIAYAGKQLFARECDGSPSQRWVISSGGALRPAADPRLCITLGAESGKAGYPEEVRPAWLHRDLTVEPCNWRIGMRQQWRFVQPAMAIRTDAGPATSE